VFLVNSLAVGGSERKTVRLANALAADKHRVMVAYLSPPESLLPLLSPSVATVNLQRRGKFSLEALRRLSNIVREQDVGTLVAMNLYSALYAVLSRSLWKTRSLRLAVSVNTTEFATRKEELQMLLYRHVLPRADVVVFGAECQRQLWSARYGLGGSRDNLVVLYNGVDTLEFSKERIAAAVLGELSDRVVLGTVGALRAEKAHVDLVRAIYELMRRGVDVGALVVGEGPARAEIESEVSRLGLQQRVRLVGEAHDVRPYLANMDIFVLPSLAVETFSNAALEAMAMSCPVVAARVGGMDEMLRFGGGMVYPPGDVKSLCDVLIPLVQSARVRQELGQQARQVAEEHFSFDRMLSDFGTYVLAAG
jgi:glycosyltransferase involved in cell wall biosynthesis